MPRKAAKQAKEPSLESKLWAAADDIAKRR